MVANTIPRKVYQPSEEQITLRTFLENGIIPARDIGFVQSLAEQPRKLTEAQEWWARTHINRYVPGAYTLGPRPLSRVQKEAQAKGAKVPANDEELMELLEDGLAVINSKMGPMAVKPEEMEALTDWLRFP